MKEALERQGQLDPTEGTEKNDTEEERPSWRRYRNNMDEEEKTVANSLKQEEPKEEDVVSETGEEKGEEEADVEENKPRRSNLREQVSFTLSLFINAFKLHLKGATNATLVSPG